MKHLLTGVKCSLLAALFGKNIVAEQQNWLCELVGRHFAVPDQLRRATAWLAQSGSFSSVTSQRVPLWSLETLSLSVSDCTSNITNLLPVGSRQQN